MDSPKIRLAVLIDADNAQASISREILDEVARYGVATVKRAYGDWTTSNLKGWKERLLGLAIQPVQQFAYTSGKNSTDSSLIIDAMDLLHSGRVDGFALISSDSDFTRLATRIRESGLFVYGFGEKKTPEAFVVACDKFIKVELLRKAPVAVAPGGEQGNTGAVSRATKRMSLKKAVLSAVKICACEEGFALLEHVDALLQRNDPAFDPQRHGHKNLASLVSAQSYIQVKRVPQNGTTAEQFFIRDAKVSKPNAARSPVSNGAAGHSSHPIQ